MKIGAKVFGVLAGILLLFLLLGIILPGTWEAEVTADLAVPPAVVFSYIDRAEEWVRWNPLPASGADFFAPDSGQGSGLSWDDPQYGRGSFTIISVERPESMVYEVSIENGTLTIRGAIHLSDQAGSTLLSWREEGDFGWNPLMGYAARGMAESQGAAMEASLDTLQALIEVEKGSGGTRPPLP